MIDTAALDHPKSAVLVVRHWPSEKWLAQWLSPNATLILSEQALIDAINDPSLIERLSITPYALHSELKLLGVDELPASIIQLGDARWVELSLDASTYMVWDNPQS
ncbi:hypothetical protein LG272_07805 [Pseudidiomarina marina]|uniref:hypothetical protein n=1 Tax=Pseudidiomarina marina TaxID=502366 RepID=UPI0038515C37